MGSSQYEDANAVALNLKNNDLANILFKLMLVGAEVVEAAAFSYFRVFCLFFCCCFSGVFFFFFFFSCCCFVFVINTSSSVYECKTYSKTRRKEGRKEMFYLTTHSTHFICTIIWRRTYGKGPFR